MKRTALSIALTLAVVVAPSARATARVGETGAKPFGAKPFTAPSVRAIVKPYTVAPNLANVTNLGRMNSVFRFTPEQRQMLAKNGFVVTPSSEEQLFFVYENNDYLNIPSFISTDAVLQVYHVFYDYTLRKVEQTRLVDELKALSAGLVDASARRAGRRARRGRSRRCAAQSRLRRRRAKAHRPRSRGADRGCRHRRKGARAHRPPRRPLAVADRSRQRR